MPRRKYKTSAKQRKAARKWYRLNSARHLAYAAKYARENYSKTHFDQKTCGIKPPKMDRGWITAFQKIQRKTGRHFFGRRFTPESNFCPFNIQG